MNTRGRIAIARLLREWPLFKGLSSRVEHLVGSPTLQDLSRCAAFLGVSSPEVIRAIFGQTFDDSTEYKEVRDRLADEFARTERRYPDSYEVEDGTANLLYTLIRQAKPSLTVEVGVADGRSTLTILSALDVNAKGRLVSVDVNKDVGAVAAGHPRWELRVHSPQRSSSHQLRELLAELGPPDVFFHDAGHAYHDQYGEYLVAWKEMRSGGILISDDVDQSWAFLDVARQFGVEPVILVDRRKAAGVLVHPGRR